jgi:hypothetical protein
MSEALCMICSADAPVEERWMVVAPPLAIIGMNRALVHVASASIAIAMFSIMLYWGLRGLRKRPASRSIPVHRT